MSWMYRHASRGLVTAFVLALVFAAAPTLAAPTTTKPDAPAKPSASNTMPRKAAKAGSEEAIATIHGRPVTLAHLGPMPSSITEAAKGDTAKLEGIRKSWQSQALTGLVLGSLLDDWAATQKIAATPAEVSQMLALASQAAESLKAENPKVPRPDTTNAQVRMASAGVVTRFKMNAALYRKYGGRVLVDPAAGPMPFEAYQRFLKEQEKAGAFTVAPAWKDRFWAAFAPEGKQFVPEKEAAAMINREWWREGVQ
jgi:hypothetical protein